MQKAILLFILLIFNVNFISAQNSIQIIEKQQLSSQPGFYNADYTSRSKNNLRSRNKISENNGKTWFDQGTTVKRLAFPPKYGRRVPVTSIFDTNNNLFVTFFNALDDPSIPKNVVEPRKAQKGYYLRYRVSDDEGASWLFDEPVKESGNYSAKDPFPSISIGENAIFLGDTGNKPILTSKGTLILPAHTTIKPDKKQRSLNKYELYNPSGGHTYTEVMMLRGVWNKNKLNWKAAKRIVGNPQKTTRGLVEPTIVELRNGRILCIMRGSNGGDFDPKYQLSSYKWMSFSTDDGRTWSSPKPWFYDNGQTFFSPSSMSVLTKHSNGKVFWIGNINEKNSQGGGPRYPLVIGEVNQSDMSLVKSSIVILDNIKESDKRKGTLDLGHVTVVEDRSTKELVVVFPRIYSKQVKRDWVQIRLKV